MGGVKTIILIFTTNLNFQLDLVVVDAVDLFPLWPLTSVLMELGKHLIRHATDDNSWPGPKIVARVRTIFP